MNAPVPDTASIFRELCEAVRLRRVVTMTYAGRPVRLAPHAVFRSSGGHLLVTGPTVPRPGERPDRPGARSFDLRNIGSLTITDEAFQPDPSFDAGSHRFRHGLECSVADVG